MNKPVKDSAVKRARGRPRDLAAREAILSAARDLLDEGGPGVVTMEAVAVRAGVSKPTVYRWWPDRHAVVMTALMSDADSSGGTRAGKSALDALRQQLRQIATRFASPTGRHITSMLAAADAESELGKAFRSHFVLARRAEGRAILERGIANGEFRGDLDFDVALDELYGAVFFRLLLGHAPLNTNFIDKLLAQAMEGIKSRSHK